MRRLLGYLEHLPGVALARDVVGAMEREVLRGLVPRYLSHLRELGLVEAEAESPALEEKYEILQTDSSVRDAIARARELGRTPRILRRTLRISELGRALWAACIRR